MTEFLRLAVVGSREYPNPRQVEDVIARLKDTKGLTIVSGGARGPDSWAVEKASRVGLPVKVYPADWTTHGKAAGMIRNSTIVNVSDVILAFWDGESRGTHDTIKKGLKKGKAVIVVLPTVLWSPQVLAAQVTTDLIATCM